MGYIKGATNDSYYHWGTATVALFLTSINCLSKWTAITKVCNRNVVNWHSTRENDCPTPASWRDKIQDTVTQDHWKRAVEPSAALTGTQPCSHRFLDFSCLSQSLNCGRPCLWESSIPNSLGAISELVLGRGRAGGLWMVNSDRK